MNWSWPRLELRCHFKKQVDWCRNWQGVHDRHNTIRGGFSIFIPGVGYGLVSHWHQNIETLWHHQHHFTRLVSSKNYFTKTMRRLTRAITTPKSAVCCYHWCTNKVKTKLISRPYGGSWFLQNKPSNVNDIEVGGADVFGQFIEFWGFLGWINTGGVLRRHLLSSFFQLIAS